MGVRVCVCVWRRVRHAEGRAGGRAGCEEGELGEHAATAEERAVLLRCRAARIRSPPRPQRLWASSWGSATQHGASCGVQVVKGVGSRGSLEPGAMEQRALRMPSPLLRISVGNVWWWGVAMGSAPERRWRRGAVFSTGTNYSRLFYLVTFYFTPRLPRG